MRCNIGIEHGNYEFRKNVLLRKTTNEGFVRGFKAFEGSPITVVANTIIGYPGETEDLIWDSIHLNRLLSPYVDSVNGFIFAPYHGTPLREKAIKEGYLSDDVIVDVGTTSGSLLTMPSLSDERLRGLQRAFPLYVKLPERYYADIKMCERLDDKGNAAHKELLNLYREKYMGRKEGSEWNDLH